MKKLIAIILALGMLFALSACGNGELSTDDEVYQEDLIAIPLGDTGVKIVLPAEQGFEGYESEINDFYGGNPGGTWRVIVNSELKSDYPDATLADYASWCAEANEGEVGQDAEGNYYFAYSKDMGEGVVYKFYTAVREGAEEYYRVAFYTTEEFWDQYKDQFVAWTATIEVE